MTKEQEQKRDAGAQIVAAIRDGAVLTERQLEELSGRDRSAVHRILPASMVAFSAGRKGTFYPAKEAIQELCRHRETAGDRRSAILAERAQVELDIRKGEYRPTSEFRDELESLLANLADIVRRLPCSESERNKWMDDLRTAITSYR